jgi:hypothetical protein
MHYNGGPSAMPEPKSETAFFWKYEKGQNAVFSTRVLISEIIYFADGKTCGQIIHQLTCTADLVTEFEQVWHTNVSPLWKDSA